jgi:hypothetical protein
MSPGSRGLGHARVDPHERPAGLDVAGDPAGPGRKFRPGSSALIRHWIACPRGATSSPASDRPARRRSGSATMSKTGHHLGDGVLHWSRVFISRK